MRSTRNIVLAAAFSFAGCFPSIPEGTIACDDDSDCPQPFVCRADQRCWHPSTDAGSGDMQDAGDVDGGSDAGDVDGGSDAGDVDGGSDAGGSDAGMDAGMTTPEDCDNGVDDDGDTFIDCADTAECAARVCVPTAPAGWNGPNAAFDGAPASAPSCGGDTPNPAYSGSRNPTADPVTCSSCVQQPPPLNQIGCCPRGTLTRYGAAGCAGSPTSSTTPAYDGQFTCINAINGAASLRVEFEPCPMGPSVNGGVACNLVTDSSPTTTPAVTWQNVARLCGANASPAAGCAANSVCLPRPPVGFSQKMCVWHAGDVACEGSSYTARTVYYSGAVDTRSCSTCTAGQMNGSITCNSVNLITSADVCGDSGPYQNYSPSGTGSVCINPVAGHTDFAWGRTAASAVAASSCNAASGGVPVGTVAPHPATATTVCCLP